MLHSHILYIIGFMGSGKTTAGKKLASLLSWTFTDMDKIIEEHTRLTIPEIFSQYGEAYFRAVETDMLISLKNKTNRVVSTGGGTPCHGNNMDFMLKTGLTLYLKMTPAQLMSRLIVSPAERPLLKDMDSESMLKFIEEKLASREKWYEKADLVVDGMDLDIGLLYSRLKPGLIIT